MSNLDPGISTGHPDAGRIYAEALERAKEQIAQQAKMIEHLRGGLGTEPQLVSYAEDMSTCTLTTGDGTGYFYDRVDPDQPASGYTAVDMANAVRDGFRGGAASVVVELPFLFPHYRQEVVAAIIAAGGSVKDE